MNNKEKGDIKTPEEIYAEYVPQPYYDKIITAIKAYHDQFKPQPLPEDVKEFIEKEAEKEASLQFNKKYSNDQWHACFLVGKIIGNLCYSTYVTPLQNHIEGLNDGYAQCEEKIKEMSETIESLQKELVVSNEEKGRLEKEKRQLLIGLHFYKNDDCVGYESISKELKITPDEVRVSVSKSDLMVKEFIK